MNISRQTVSKWELDVAQPEMDKAIDLCKFINNTKSCAILEFVAEE